MKKKRTRTMRQQENRRQWLAYSRWHGQRDRCYNTNCHAYGNYGAMGIQVEYSSKEFTDWFMSKTKDISIEEIKIYDVGRIDHKENYRIDNIELQLKTDNSKERNARRGNPFHGLNDKMVMVTDNLLQGSFIAKNAVEASALTGATSGKIAFYRNGKNARPQRLDARFNFFGVGF